MRRNQNYPEVNEFVGHPEDYSRDLDIIGNALDDTAHYLHISTGKPLAECKAFVLKEASPEGTLPIQPKNMKVTFREANGDRRKAAMDFDRFLKGVGSRNSILTPNMVVYDHPSINKSFIASFIDDGMAERSKVKKLGQLAEMEGDKATAEFCANRQNTIKLLLNSTSGAHASPHNPLYNKTAHSSLTSTCRIATSYSNSNTERLLAGNRHYWSPEITINNIISVTRLAEYDKIEKVIAKYNIVYPTVEDTLKCIWRCTKFYWDDPKGKSEVTSLIHKLTPIQRAAFVYSGDLYHVAKLNDSFMRDFVTEAITRPTEIPEDMGDVIGNAVDDAIALCGFLCADLLDGKTVKNLKSSNPEGYRIYEATLHHVERLFSKYEDFIQALLATPSLPPSVWSFPTSIRRCVIGSDTDSTMFTCQDWVEWYFGKLVFGQEADCVTNVFVYINSQMVAHCLASASKQMGVIDENLYRLKMKNEFGFPVFMVANRAKHYATLISSCEGNVYPEPKVEIKGVALKDSKNPPAIMKALENNLKSVMMDITLDKGVNIFDILQTMANLEHEVRRSLESGSIEYLSNAYIKEEGAYKNPMSSNFIHYSLWTDVFADTYGHTVEPPYGAVKVGVMLDSPRLVERWLTKIDPVIAERMRGWMAKTGRTNFSQFLLPTEVVEGGIPKEISMLLDVRKLISEMFAGNYIMLEMLGFYYRNKNNTRLVSDEIPYRPHGD